MNARFTLVGFENLLNDMETSRSLKDPWELEDCEDFSAETLLSTIMLKGAQMEPLYSNPEFFYMMNKQWWDKWKHTFAGWCAALHAEYNPLWNKDYYEQVHDDEYTVGHEENTVNEKQSGKDMVDHDYNRDVDTENRVSAYDADPNHPYVPHDTSHVDDIMNSENTDTTYGKNVKTDGEDDATRDRDYDHNGHYYGNIGVTTSQQLIKEELELRYWNFYDHVSDIFLDEMAVRVY